MKSAVLFALAAAALAPAAQAAPVLTISGASGIFADDRVSGDFTRTFTFGEQKGFRLASLDISSIASSAATDVDFTSVTFNGVEFNTVATGRQELRNLFDQALRMENTIVVRGVSGADGAFSGTISLAAVPEPATWAMMIGGFGAIGVAARRRTRVTVAYA